MKYYQVFVTTGTEVDSKVSKIDTQVIMHFKVEEGIELPTSHQLRQCYENEAQVIRSQGNSVSDIMIAKALNELFSKAKISSHEYDESVKYINYPVDFV